MRKHRPELVVADVDMPHMTGLELCRAIEEDPALAGTPVVLITAYLLPGDPRMTGSGAAAVSGKPFGVPDLSAALRRHLDVAVARRTSPEVPDRALLEALLDGLEARHRRGAASWPGLYVCTTSAGSVVHLSIYRFRCRALR